jgi:hypothetical protein
LKTSEFLSDYQEWHAAILGLYDGVLHRRADHSRWRDASAEPHYYAGGYMLGNRPKWLLGGALVGGSSIMCQQLVNLILP